MAQWENQCISLSVISVALYTGLGRPMARTTAEIEGKIVEWRPFRKCVQSHGDHEMPMDSPAWSMPVKKQIPLLLLLPFFI